MQLYWHKDNTAASDHSTDQNPSLTARGYRGDQQQYRSKDLEKRRLDNDLGSEIYNESDPNEGELAEAILELPLVQSSKEIHAQDLIHSQ